ncbi:MAG: hypothetical protein H0U16_02985, partial [Actinobacteria bacterium]|nr:hypothetical protein [Actinomycetota bacterium]
MPSSPTAAQSAGDIPVSIQTVPALAGAELTFDGATYAADRHGLAFIYVEEPGTYQLRIADPGGDEDGSRVRFARWSDGETSPERSLTVDSFTFLEAGFNLSYLTTPKVVGPDGTEIVGADVGTLRVRDDRGRKRELTAGEPVWLPAAAAVRTTSGLKQDLLSYRLEKLRIDGHGIPAKKRATFKPSNSGDLRIKVPDLSNPAPIEKAVAKAGAGEDSPAGAAAGLGGSGVWLLTGLLLLAALAFGV